MHTYGTSPSAISLENECTRGGFAIGGPRPRAKAVFVLFFCFFLQNLILPITLWKRDPAGVDGSSTAIGHNSLEVSVCAQRSTRPFVVTSGKEFFWPAMFE